MSVQDVWRRLPKRWVQLGLGIALSIGFGWLALRGTEWDGVLDEFRRLSIPHALGALGLFVLFTVLRAYRW